ncbi:MAG: indolepyruvate oxidoreductase subunit beta [Gemmatimonadota bacterium]
MTVFQSPPTNEQYKRSGWRIAIVGAGGQGVLTAAQLLCAAFVEQGHVVVSGQLRGMSQRGGSVQSSVMVDCGISPVIAAGAADFVLGFEPVETARALPLMSRRTLVLMNTTPVFPYVLALRSVLEEREVPYPEVSELTEHIRAVTPNVYGFDATTLAAEAGTTQVLNMIMLGCLLGTEALPCPVDGFLETVARIIPPSLVEFNTKAIDSGIQVGKTLQLAEVTA